MVPELAFGTVSGIGHLSGTGFILSGTGAGTESYYFKPGTGNGLFGTGTGTGK
jgi:hypothetical protein